MVHEPNFFVAMLMFIQIFFSFKWLKKCLEVEEGNCLLVYAAR